MGTFVEAHCACGYEAGLPGTLPLLFGCGARLVHSSTGRPMFEPFGPDWAPAACPSCRAVVNVGIEEETCLCPVCRGPVSLFTEPGFFVVPEGLGLSVVPDQLQKSRKPDKLLLHLRFRCPACGKMELRFTVSPSGAYT